MIACTTDTYLAVVSESWPFTANLIGIISMLILFTSGRLEMWHVNVQKWTTEI